MLPLRSFAFVESTETQDELPTNISGVWLLVNHIEITKGASPSPGASPAPTLAPKKGAAAGNVRYFTVANLVRVVHYAKADADTMREADRKMEDGIAIACGAVASF